MFAGLSTDFEIFRFYIILVIGLLVYRVFRKPTPSKLVKRVAIVLWMIPWFSSVPLVVFLFSAGIALVISIRIKEPSTKKPWPAQLRATDDPNQMALWPEPARFIPAMEGRSIEETQKILDEIPAALIYVDSDSRVKIFNLAASELFGCASDYAKGKLFASEIINTNEESRVKVIVAVNQALNGEVTTDFQFQHLTVSDVCRHLELSVKKIDQQGDSTCVVRCYDATQHETTVKKLLHQLENLKMFVSLWAKRD
mmetsp:Transcript_28241/g.60177  ORF Transcript_28241/g.60177 Transcript_28241/m.60177 type:complete len:254 (+) Transcript_28241:387-1148(+)|eukprot:CAMPEP_0172308932 /NCGR_PEP_ID=MMETSP1058-20130122/9381_1 /TAXON_ID=83371 /ORGANISM="Detonula confervacea, Strain CCMP 353" /LENGTH=253 /DNA_ID=CAMNT_0013021461 /DNA_START=376 /DNA_END=1137 /DNA_ORIENTATION=-